MSAIRYGQDREEHWDDEQDDTFALPSSPAPAVLQPPQRRAAGPDHVRGRLLRRDPRREGTAVQFLQHDPRLHPARARGHQHALIDRDLQRTADLAPARRAAFPGGAGGFPGAALGGGNASIGTVSSVDGNTIYITDTSGNTVKVTLSSATKITKSLGVSKHSLHPGDSVVIRGLKNKQRHALRHLDQRLRREQHRHRTALGQLRAAPAGRWWQLGRQLRCSAPGHDRIREDHTTMKKLTPGASQHAPMCCSRSPRPWPDRRCGSSSSNRAAPRPPRPAPPRARQQARRVPEAARH